nr:unnamed protein product [Callosobruchus analis]
MTDNNLENRLDVNSEDDESFHGFPPEDSFQGSGRQAAQNVDSDAHVSNNSTDTNLAKLFQDMMVENRRRDALIERLVDKLTVQPAGPNTNVPVMPELLKNLTTFDGNSANAKQWIKSLTSAQLLHDLPDTYMLETARTRFNSTFVPKESFSTKWRKMVARTQHKGEGLSGYFHEKVKLCKELDLDIRELKEQVLIGLWSKQMCDAMFGIKHFSVDQLFHDLQEYSQLESERVSRIVEASHNRSITRGGTIPRRDADGVNVQGPRDISRDASRQIPQRNERSATRKTSATIDHVGFITVYTEDYSNENVFVDAQNYENKFIPRCIITLEHGEAAIPVYNLTAYDAKMDANIKLTKGEYCSEQVEQHLEVNTVVIDGAEDMNTDINRQDRRPNDDDLGNDNGDDTVIILPYAERSCPMCEDKGHNIFHMTVQDECKHIKKEHPRANIRYRCKFCFKMYQIRHAALCHVPKCPKVAAAAAAPPPEPSGSGRNDGLSSPPIPKSEGQACPIVAKSSSAAVH